MSKGFGTGPVVNSPAHLSFLCGGDPETWKIVENCRPREGEFRCGMMLVCPHGKGSTVGSYIIYALGKNGKAPAAMINEEAEPIIATGAIIGSIPLVDRLEGGLSTLQDGVLVRVDGEKGTVEIIDDPSHEGTT